MTNDETKALLLSAADPQGREEGWAGASLDEAVQVLPFYDSRDINACGEAKLHPMPDQECVYVALSIQLPPDRAAEVIRYVTTGKGFVRLISESAWEAMGEAQSDPGTPAPDSAKDLATRLLDAFGVVNGRSPADELPEVEPIDDAAAPAPDNAEALAHAEALAPQAPAPVQSAPVPASRASVVNADGGDVR